MSSKGMTSALNQSLEYRHSGRTWPCTPYNMLKDAEITVPVDVNPSWQHLVFSLNKKYLRCYFILEYNSYLLFEDIRIFGGFYLYKNLKELKSRIALDPLQKKFTIAHFKRTLSFRKKQI